MSQNCNFANLILAMRWKSRLKTHLPAVKSQDKDKDPASRSNLVRLSKSYLLLNFMASFCAMALHNEVFPVPGGPCSRIVRLNEMR